MDWRAFQQSSTLWPETMSGKTKDRSKEEKRRRDENAAYKAAAAIKTGTTYPPLIVAKKPRRPRAPLISAPTAAALAQQGVDLVGTNLFIGTLERTSYGPLRVVEALGQAHPKPQKIESPTRLAIVRLMPCSVCGKGRSFEESLRWVAESGDWKVGAQSEANHHPAKGRGGGGSDYLVHPVCTDCHRKITDNVEAMVKVEGLLQHLRVTGLVLHALVAETSRLIDLAIREGKLQTATLVACSVAAFVNAERSQ